MAAINAPPDGTERIAAAPLENVTALGARPENTKEVAPLWVIAKIVPLVDGGQEHTAAIWRLPARNVEQGSIQIHWGEPQIVSHASQANTKRR